MSEGSDRMKLDRIRRLHSPPPSEETQDSYIYICQECGKTWPCVTARLSAWELG